MAKGFSSSLLWRQRKLFSLRLLFVSILLAVATVSTITSITGALKSSLVSASSNFLAGDRQLTSPRDVPPEWLLKAKTEGLAVSKSAEFSTMVLSSPRLQEESFQLVSVKAVDEYYPLKGDLEVGQMGDGKVLPQGAPTVGELFLQPRLVALLGYQADDALAIGEHEMTVRGELLSEPDVGFQLAGIAPRVMMRIEELGQTEVIQPGSRVVWRYYFAGADNALQNYENWLAPKLNSTQRWTSIKEGRPSISNALEKAENYLLLGGSLAVLLASLAIAISARQFASEQTQTVAVLKTLGYTGSKVMRTYGLQLFVLSSLALAAGLVVTLIVNNVWLFAVQPTTPQLEHLAWLPVSSQSLVLAIVTTFLCVMSFALPQLGKLRSTPPMRVLRSGMASESAFGATAVLSAAIGLLVLLYFYSQSWVMVGALLGVTLVLGLILAVLHGGVLNVGSRFLLKRISLGSPMRFAVQGLSQNKAQTLLQLIIFTLAFFLFLVLFFIRTTLIEDWQAQLPDDAPNHFLINIAPEDRPELSSTLAQIEADAGGIYPMVRGRLSHINDIAVREAVSKEEESLNRELNLSWASEIAPDNELLEGKWWPELGEDAKQSVSIESRLAQRLGIEMGDKLTFSMAGEPIDVTVASIRRVQWDSMRPNFYMLFAPGGLDGFEETYISSFFLDKTEKNKLNQITRNFPTITVLEMDPIIEKVRSIVEQVSNMLMLLLAFVLIAALLVLAALVAASKKVREHSAVLVRTLGGSRQLLMRSQLFEFAILGVLSGIIAVAGAEISTWIFKRELFEGSFNPLVFVWFAFPVVAAALLSAFGYWQTRRIPDLSPVQVLRDIGS